MLLARHIIFTLGLISLLSACGFQLRGSGGSALPESWHDMYLVKVKTPAESKGEWDLYEVVSTIPGDEAFRPIGESQCQQMAPKG